MENIYTPTLKEFKKLLQVGNSKSLKKSKTNLMTNFAKMQRNESLKKTAHLREQKAKAKEDAKITKKNK